MPEQGDIVLLPVPFTDLSSSKRRPVIVVSKNDYHQTTSDMIVVAMTSNPTRTRYSLVITSNDLTTGGLNRPGYVRADKIYTLAQKIAIKTFGRVNDATLERIRLLLQELTEI
jgi:mRNA interferase MazF